MGQNQWNERDGKVFQRRVTGEVELVAAIVGKPEVLKVVLKGDRSPTYTFSIVEPAHVYCDGKKSWVPKLFEWLMLKNRVEVVLHLPQGRWDVSKFTEFISLG